MHCDKSLKIGSVSAKTRLLHSCMSMHQPEVWIFCHLALNVAVQKLGFLTVFLAFKFEIFISVMNNDCQLLA